MTIYNEAGFFVVYNKNVKRDIQAMYVITVYEEDNEITSVAAHWNGWVIKLIEGTVIRQNLDQAEIPGNLRERSINRLRTTVEEMTTQEVADFENDYEWIKIGAKERLRK